MELLAVGVAGGVGVGGCVTIVLGREGPVA